eukprot:gnl/TRDRNA2_/TRDRNA2_96559_c0_seq4.p2 gnl/TRDRNA2_/TRDRNA2_96559_c0~~gnl/TRDRNA2_/TRDRNA2_96559_c0_seq4.p2  ORF type:complete len:154 (+),score=14.40 gnl/TRDRNA2_/TRDRNA2_96559_c0_seq4:30-464(+)
MADCHYGRPKGPKGWKLQDSTLATATLTVHERRILAPRWPGAGAQVVEMETSQQAMYKVWADLRAKCNGWWMDDLDSTPLEQAHSELCQVISTSRRRIAQSGGELNVMHSVHDDVLKSFERCRQVARDAGVAPRASSTERTKVE